MIRHLHIRLEYGHDYQIARHQNKKVIIGKIQYMFLDLRRNEIKDAHAYDQFHESSDTYFEELSVNGITQRLKQFGIKEKRHTS